MQAHTEIHNLNFKNKIFPEVDMERKAFLRISFGLICMEVGFWLITFIYAFLLDDIVTSAFSQNADLGYAVSMVLSNGLSYGVMIFFVWLFMRGLPEIPLQKKMSVSVAMIFVLILINQGVGYVLAYVGYYADHYFQMLFYPTLNRLFVLPPPTDTPNRVGIPRYAEIFCSVIMAPICEEYIFRKLLLDKLRAFGDVTAILITAITFGLTHNNFHQFFFAAFSGLIAGYIMLKTGKLFYPILLHFMFNMMGTFLSTICRFLDNIYPSLGDLIGDGIIFGLMVIGPAIFFSIFKKIKLEKAPFQFSEPVGGGMILGNAGSILYIVMCIFFFSVVACLSIMVGDYQLF